jgi:hypothetical protein
MKALVAILLFAMAPRLWCGETPGTITGTWFVTGYRFAGNSALSDKQAKSWLGKTLVIGTTCLSLGGARISSPRFQQTVHDAETYFMEGFRIKPSDVGYRASKLYEYAIMHENGKPWVEPGSTLVILNDTEALTTWDGVFFVLKRKLPNKRIAVDGALSAYRSSQARRQ